MLQKLQLYTLLLLSDNFKLILRQLRDNTKSKQIKHKKKDNYTYK